MDRAVKTEDIISIWNGRSRVDLSSNRDKTWEVNRVFVDPDKRGKGIGTNMLTDACKVALESGANEITVTPHGYGSSISALFKFYKGCGFEHTDNEHTLILKRPKSFLEKLFGTWA